MAAPVVSMGFPPATMYSLPTAAYPVAGYSPYTIGPVVSVNRMTTSVGAPPFGYSTSIPYRYSTPAVTAPAIYTGATTAFPSAGYPYSAMYPSAAYPATAFPGYAPVVRAASVTRYSAPPVAYTSYVPPVTSVPRMAYPYGAYTASTLPVASITRSTVVPTPVATYSAPVIRSVTRLNAPGYYPYATLPAAGYSYANSSYGIPSATPFYSSTMASYSIPSASFYPAAATTTNPVYPAPVSVVSCSPGKC